MTTAVAVRPRVALGRTAAALSVASAAVHLLLLDAGSLGSLVMLVLAAVCLPCAWHLWRSPTGTVWRTTALLDAGMLALHLQMVAGAGHAMPGMQHAGAGQLTSLALGLVTAQLALAAAAAVPLRR